MLSADKLCRQFGPRSATTICWSQSESKLFNETDGIPERIFWKKKADDRKHSKLLAHAKS